MKISIEKLVLEVVGGPAVATKVLAEAADELALSLQIGLRLCYRGRSRLLPQSFPFRLRLSKDGVHDLRLAPGASSCVRRELSTLSPSPHDLHESFSDEQALSMKGILRLGVVWEPPLEGPKR